jgi:hypothetical protein
MKRFTQHFRSPAMIVAMLALIVSLGSNSWAQDAVTAPVAGVSKLLKGSKIKKNSIPGNRLKKNSVGGKQVAESKLGKVPKAKEADNAGKLDNLDSADFLRSTAKAADADKLDGIDGSGYLGANAKATDADKLDGLSSGSFVQGGGVVDFARQTLTVGTSNTNFLSLGGVGKVEISCPAGPEADVTFRNTSGATETAMLDVGADNPLFNPALANNGTQTDATAGANTGDFLTWQVSYRSGFGVFTNTGVATFAVSVISGPPGEPTSCRFAGQGIVQTAGISFLL